ncbi:MAG: substrate-binding domain-containing protein, partial [Chthoniobacteraceae bacterium]
MLATTPVHALATAHSIPPGEAVTTFSILVTLPNSPDPIGSYIVEIPPVGRPMHFYCLDPPAAAVLRLRPASFAALRWWHAPPYSCRVKSSLAQLLFVSVVALCSTALAKDYTIAVIPKGTTHEFWKSVHAGTVKAEEELNAKGIKTKVFWKGPLREDDRDQQIQTVENFATRGVSGIVLAPLDSQALVNPVVSAIQAGIPVVVFDSDLKSDKQVSFVATDNFKGGQMAGDFLAQQLGGKGNVILLRYAVGSASTEAREAGFLD